MSTESFHPTTRFGGIRRAAVDQLLADRDMMLRQAEDRVAAAEARVAELEEQLEAAIADAKARSVDGASMQALEGRLAGLKEQEARTADVAARRERELAELRTRLEEAEAAHASQPRQDELTTRLLSDEVNTVLSAAQESAVRIVERARRESEDMSASARAESEELLSGARRESAELREQAHAQSEEMLASARRDSDEMLTSARAESVGMLESARRDKEEQLAESGRTWREIHDQQTKFVAWRDEVQPMMTSVQDQVVRIRASLVEVPARIRDALAPVAEAMSSIDTEMAQLSVAFGPPAMQDPGNSPADPAGGGIDFRDQAAAAFPERETSAGAAGYPEAPLQGQPAEESPSNGDGWSEGERPAEGEDSGSKGPYRLLAPTELVESDYGFDGVLPDVRFGEPASDPEAGGTPGDPEVPRGGPEPMEHHPKRPHEIDWSDLTGL
jgi:hypothetical protein